MQSMNRFQTIEDLDAYREELLRNRDPDRIYVTVCGGTGCSAWGGDALRHAFTEEIAKQGLSSKVEVKKTGCHGFCERGPITVILPQEIFYQKLTVEDVPEVVGRPYPFKHHRPSFLIPSPTAKEHLQPRSLYSYRKIVFRQRKIDHGKRRLPSPRGYRRS